MMQRMTLQSMLKQAGDVIKPEEIKALNDALQRIKKVTD
jgi:beta-galactosidase